MRLARIFIPVKTGLNQSTSQTISVAGGIASAEVVGNAQVLPGAVNLTAQPINSVEAMGALNVTTRAFINAAGMTSAQAFGNANVLPGAVAINPISLNSAEAFGNALVQSGAINVQLAGISSTQQVGAAALLGGTDLVGWLTAHVETQAGLHATIKNVPALLAKPEVNRVH